MTDVKEEVVETVNMQDAVAPVTLTPNDAIKQIVKSVGDLSALISSITQGFSFAEVTELIAIAADLPAVIKDAPAVAAQYAALDDESRADLVSYVAQNVSFPANVAVQEGIVLVLDAAIALSKVFSLFHK